MAERILWKEKDSSEIAASVKELYDTSRENSCPVNRLNAFSTEAMKKSCGECVICREGTYQIMVQTADMILGKGSEEDLELIGEIVADMKLGSCCDYGKEVAQKFDELLAPNTEMFSKHFKRKRCDIGVCEKLSSTPTITKKEGGLMGGARRRRRSS